jgi:hypothetical protein
VPGVAQCRAAPFRLLEGQLTSVDGRPTTEPPPDVMTVVVEPAYFQTLVGGLVLGEPFSELHGTPGHEAAIVNQQFASVYLGAGNPIGRRLEIRPPTARRTYLREADSPAPPVSVVIIGVAPDIRQIRDAVPMVYLPFRAEAPAAVALIVRGSADRALVAASATPSTPSILSRWASRERSTNFAIARGRTRPIWHRTSRKSAAWRSSSRELASTRRWRTP